MTRNKALALYLIGTLGQIWMICIIVFLLRKTGMIVDYTTPVGMAAIAVGGIEEIGWRYTFQPILQECHNYISSTLITFIAWGIWHFSYFYIEGTLPQVQVFV